MERGPKNAEANQKLQEEFKEAILPWYQEVTEGNPWVHRLKSLKPFDKGEEDSLLEEILNAGPELVDSLMDLANARDDGGLLPSLPKKAAIDRLGQLHLEENVPNRKVLSKMLWTLSDAEIERDEEVRRVAFENMIDYRKEGLFDQEEVTRRIQKDPYPPIHSLDSETWELS